MMIKLIKEKTIGIYTIDMRERYPENEIPDYDVTVWKKDGLLRSFRIIEYYENLSQSEAKEKFKVLVLKYNKKIN